MSPFPLYDTGYIEDITKIEKNMKQSKMDYDELPVVACKHCNNLWIENDEVENDVCMRCGTVNELIIYPNIHDYLKTKEDDSE
jgi:phage FluMu protein Com